MLSADRIAAVLEVMGELFDCILIDCGHHMSESLVAVWEHSSHLLYPVEQSISSVRPAQRFLEMFARLGLSDLDLQIVLNRYSAANPFTVEKIEAALRRPIATRIPRDDATFVQLQLHGVDLAAVAPRSATHLAIDDLARTISGLPALSESAAGASLLSWIRARFSRLAGAASARPARDEPAAVQTSTATL